jgi:hypothetical protein
MPNPLISKGHPQRFLWTAVGDLLLGLVTAAIWQGLIPLGEKWKIVPHWVWPLATGLLLLSAVYAYFRHIQLKPRS